MLKREGFFEYLLFYWLVARSKKAAPAKQRGIWLENTTTLLVGLRDAARTFPETDKDIRGLPVYVEEKQCVAYRRAALSGLFHAPTYALTRYDIYEGTPFTDNLDWFVTTESYRTWRDDGVINPTERLSDELLLAISTQREKDRLAPIVVPTSLLFAGMVFAGTSDQVTRIGVRRRSAIRHALRLYVGKSHLPDDASEELLLQEAGREERAAVLENALVPTVTVPPRLTEFLSPKAARVLVCGSGSVPAELQPFAIALGRQLITETKYVLITGGLASRAGEGTPSDMLTIAGAREGLRLTQEDPAHRVLTILPAIERPGSNRFDDGLVVRVERAGTTARRYAMALAADALIGIGGKASAALYDFAWVAGKPLLPLAFTGDAALQAWRDYRDRIIERFRLTGEEVDLLETGKASAEALAGLCIRIIRRRLRRRCYVLAPKFLPEPRALDVICNVLDERQFDAVRSDDVGVIGMAFASPRDGLSGAELVIADVSYMPPGPVDESLANVFYQLGMADMLGKQHVLLTAYSTGDAMPTYLPEAARRFTIVRYRTHETLRNELRRLIPPPDTSSDDA
jgi:hypothetical protein